MRKFTLAVLLFCAFAGVMSTTAMAQLPQAILGPGLNSGRTDYFQSWNRTLSADTVYVLTGLYYVDSTYTLSIPEGTVIKGDTAATLIVRRGGKLIAKGEPFNPIVFTSLKNPGARARGDWGGIVVLGRAPVNKVNPLIEGGIIFGSFGGNDPHDNSGIIRYVRIEYPGYRFQLDNEINGLTMGGVGDGTEIHHVQVSYSFDDSYEFFGGTVNPHHLVAFGGTDDEFDSDFGNVSHLQFLFGLKDPNFSDPTGNSRGIESDNDGTGTNDMPFTRQIISNATLVGPERTDALVGAFPFETFDWSAHIRRNSRTSVFNSVIMGYPDGVRIESAGSAAAAAAGILQWNQVEIQASVLDGTIPNAGCGIPQHVHDESSWPCNSGTVPGVYNWFETPAFNNNGSLVRSPSSIGLTNMTDLNNPDPVPAAGSPLIGAADFSDADLATLQAVSYSGAFDPALPMAQQWTRGWSNFDPQNTDYSTGTTVVSTGIGDGDGGDTPKVSGIEAINYPNPFNPSTTIRFTLPQAGQVRLDVYDVSGAHVTTLVNGLRPQGENTVTWNAKNGSGQNVSTGIYFYRIRSGNDVLTRKMILLK